MGLDPTIWGPPAWMFLHSIALNYPSNPTIKDKNNYRVFFETLSNILPCNMCSKHFNKYINENPIENYLNDNISINKWLLNAHNNVNKLNGKKEIDYKEYLDIYKSIYENNIFNYKIFIIFIIVIIVLFVVYYKFNNLKYLLNL